MSTKRSAVLLCGHGTRDVAGAAHFKDFVRRFQERHPGERVRLGNLELADPDFGTALERLYAEGIREVEALPVLLFKAGHAKSDIPRALEAAAKPLEGLRLRLGEPLGVGPDLLGMAERLALRSLSEAGLEAGDCDLLVVGRGTSDEDANSEVAKFTRLIWERLGVVEARYGFIACAKPAFPVVLREMALQARRPLLVLPLVLFTGVLARGVQEAIRQSRKLSSKPILAVPPLAVDSGCVQAFAGSLRRMREMPENQGCLLCRHRPKNRTGEAVKDPHLGHDHGVSLNLLAETSPAKTSGAILCSAWCSETREQRQEAT